MPADDVRRLIKAHCAQLRQRQLRVVDGKAVVLRHGVREQHMPDAQRFGQRDFLRRELCRVEAQRRKVRAAVARLTRHCGEHIALVIAVQAGDAVLPEQRHRLARAGAEIDLVAKRDDAVRAVLSADVAQHDLERRQIGVNVGKQGDTHGFLRLSQIVFFRCIWYNSVQESDFLPVVSRETICLTGRAMFHVKQSVCSA